MPGSVVLPCYVHNITTYRRLRRWLTFMARFVKPRLDYNRIILLDNNSDPKFLNKLNATVFDEDQLLERVGKSDLFAVRYKEHIARGPIAITNEYDYFWRALYQLPKLHGRMIPFAEKYYWIDSDVFLLTNEFIDHMKNQNSGLIRYWDHQKQWPESILMTVNTDSLHLLAEDSKKGFKGRTDLAEWSIPVTLQDKTFKGSRYPEYNQETPPDAHWVGQCERKHKVKFRG